MWVSLSVVCVSYLSSPPQNVSHIDKSLRAWLEFLSSHCYLTALLASPSYVAKIKTNVGGVFYSLQSAFISVILLGHTNGKPEDRGSVLDSTWICYVTRASHLTLVIDHLRNGGSNTYSVPNSIDYCEYAWDKDLPTYEELDEDII